MRIATWNLERASSRAWKKAPAQNARMADVDADVWVLTETFTERRPGPDYVGVACPNHPDRRPRPSERWTAIWSRWPLAPLDDPAPHRRGTIAARVETPIGPLIVYGCVIAWSHEPTFDDGRPARAWEVHAAEVDRQVSEWRRIRDLHPNVPLVVAGDFNQARSGHRWSYGTRAARQAVTDGLEELGMTCLTEIDLMSTGIHDRPHVEHICATNDLDLAGSVMAWSATNDDGTVMSDHPVIAVDLRRG